MTPGVPFNWAALATATVAGIILGFLWYGPLFGKQWIKLAGIDVNAMNAKMKNGMAGTYVLMVLGTFLMAFVMLHDVVFGAAFLNISGVTAGVQAAFWNWLGYIVPVTLGVVLWEGKSWSLWFLNAGYYLVSMIMMGVILAVWQ